MREHAEYRMNKDTQRNGMVRGDRKGMEWLKKHKWNKMDGKTVEIEWMGKHKGNGMYGEI